jgi:hypothetical protein
MNGKKEGNAMDENQKKILEMLAENKISADEAYRLLHACGEEGKEKVKVEPDTRVKPKYLRVTVTPGEGHADHAHAERVNVRIPMSLVRAGLKLTSLIPPDALDKANNALREKGINFDVRNIKPGDLEDLVAAIGDMEIDIEGGRGEKVKVFVE